MADDAGVLHVVNKPEVVLRRLGRIHTYEVMEADLDHLDQVVSEENRALGFLSLCFGVVAGTGVSAITSWPGESRPGRVAALVAILAIFGLATLWFFLTWRRARKVRPTLIARIKARPDGS